MRETGRFKERYDFSLDSRQLGIVLFAAIVAAALLFVLGMSVGRQWERKVAAKENPAAVQAPPKAPAPEEVVPAAPPVKPAVADAVPAAPEKPQAATAKEKAEKPVKEEPAPEPIKPEELTFPKVLAAKGKTPVVASKTAAKEKKATPTGKFTVQVGAFRDKPTADELMARLKKAGYSPAVHVTNGSGGSRIYRVHVGSFSSKADAQKLAGKLASSMRLKPYVTSY